MSGLPPQDLVLWSGKESLASAIFRLRYPPTGEKAIGDYGRITDIGANGKRNICIAFLLARLGLKDNSDDVICLDRVNRKTDKFLDPAMKNKHITHQLRDPFTHMSAELQAWHTQYSNLIWSYVNTRIGVQSGSDSVKNYKQDYPHTRWYAVSDLRMFLKDFCVGLERDPDTRKLLRVVFTTYHPQALKNLAVKGSKEIAMIHDKIFNIVGAFTHRRPLSLYYFEWYVTRCQQHIRDIVTSLADRSALATLLILAAIERQRGQRLSVDTFPRSLTKWCRDNNFEIRDDLATSPVSQLIIDLRQRYTAAQQLAPAISMLHNSVSDRQSLVSASIVPRDLVSTYMTPRDAVQAFIQRMRVRGQQSVSANDTDSETLRDCPLDVNGALTTQAARVYDTAKARRWTSDELSLIARLHEDEEESWDKISAALLQFALDTGIPPHPLGQYRPSSLRGVWERFSRQRLDHGTRTTWTNDLTRKVVAFVHENPEMT